MREERDGSARQEYVFAVTNTETRRVEAGGSVARKRD
jgi:hypothetical protein